jgi:tRNA threonylcarbamoyladenosine biosynthesis protein TsaE
MDVTSPDEMRALGERIGAAVRPGDVIGLVGDLGAGKTLLVQGLARGLGVPDEAHVTSPTFTLVHIYQGGRLPLFHVDLYRLDRAEELEDVGLDDLYRQEGVAAIEWIDRIPEAAPPDVLIIRIEVTGETSRRVTFEPRGNATDLATIK